MKVNSPIEMINFGTCPNPTPKRNTLMDITAYKELVIGGGSATVPCLRIEREGGEVEWLYESLDIMRFIDGVTNQLTH